MTNKINVLKKHKTDIIEKELSENLNSEGFF